MTMQSVAEKVTAFITRHGAAGLELLIFEHPSAGIQLPAGTVEEGEPHEEAAAREAREESGLLDLPRGRFLEAVSVVLPEHQAIVLKTTTVFPRPDSTGFDWAHIRNGIIVDVHHVGREFCHISYIERDPNTDLGKVNYQITGWIPTSAITRQITRYFYHFPYHGRTPERWPVDIDYHRFLLFWASLSHLPEIVEPQRGWHQVLIKHLDKE